MKRKTVQNKLAQNRMSLVDIVTDPYNHNKTITTKHYNTVNTWVYDNNSLIDFDEHAPSEDILFMQHLLK